MTRRLPAAVAAAEDHAEITLVGTLTSVNRHVTKQKRDWATGRMDCGDGIAPLVVFPVQFDSCHQHLVAGLTVEVRGRVDRRDRPCIRVATVTPTGGVPG